MKWTLKSRCMALVGLVIFGVGLGEAAAQMTRHSAEDLAWAKVQIETKMKPNVRDALKKKAEAARRSPEETFLIIQDDAAKARRERRRRRLDEDSGDVDVPE
jgi:acetate kinase